MRKTSIPLYLASLVITVAIFAIGVYVGTILDAGNVDSLQKEIERSNQLALSAQLMVLFGDTEAFCPVYAEELEKLDRDTENVGLKLAYLEDVKEVTDEELKREYFVLETNAFLLSEKVKGKCGGDYATVLYFYSNKNCSQCKQQGYELIALKQKLGERVRIYSFDGELGSSLVDALETQYGIAEYPSMVFGGNRTLGGFMDAASLEEEVS